MAQRKEKITVLTGGASEEREISLRSGKAIVAGLKRLEFDVTVLEATNGGAVDFESIQQKPPSDPISLLQALKKLQPDVVFLALHGRTGENGTIQALLEFAGLLYTGSGVTASAVAMSKPLTKQIGRSLGINTPDWRWAHVDDRKWDDIAFECLEDFGAPMIVKPAHGGSTVGLTVVREEVQIHQAYAQVSVVEQTALFERYVKGREMTVAVFEGTALPVVEITPKSGLYDYKAKYTSGGSEYICPARITDAAKLQMQTDSEKIYTALECRGIARADFMLDESDTPHFLEINTIPGMTELSLAPMSAKGAGYDFDQLLRMIVNAAYAKRGSRFR